MKWTLAEISISLLMRFLFPKILVIFLHYNSTTLPIFASQKLSLSWILLLYQVIITITCWHHLFEIISLFFSPPYQQYNASISTFFGICPWNAVYQNTQPVAQYCLQRNTSQSKCKNHCIYLKHHKGTHWGSTDLNSVAFRHGS